MDIAELNRLYNEAETCDSDLFAEQRSNVLLVAGEHYNKKLSKTLQRVREDKSLSADQKLRITKNHIQKITKTYVNNILGYAPGVTAVPKNDSELQDQKAAELHAAVLRDIKHKHKIRSKIRDWANDYINIGEVAVKVFFDYGAGSLVGYEAEVDPITGQPVVDANGQMVASNRAVFSGDLVFERIFGFNLLRAPEAKSMIDSPYVIVRKMIDIDVLKGMLAGDEDKIAKISANQDETYTVFDGSNYTATKKQTMLREYYFRPSQKYPQGYYYITTNSVKLWEGELPKGLFPIIYKGFDELETSPRSRSIIKQLRPYQVEINRAASKIAEHQITLGDDKILVQKGTNIANGGQQPGVRAIQYTGMTPTILPGRSGEQYADYMNSQIDEMYKVSNVFEDSEEKDAQLDPYALLFRTIRNKKRFSLYAEKFEEFLVEVHELALELKREYSNPNDIIPAIGRNEAINIQEFKNSQPLSYQIKLEAQSDDIESKMGKLLSLNHILQYVGNQLPPDAIGKIISVMPYVNGEEAFNDLTIDYKNATNDILALDRGDYPETNYYDDHVYAAKRLANRMKQSDFKLLPPQIQNNYRRKKAEHEAFEAERQRKIIAAKSEYIPVDDTMVVCDFYVPDPKDPLKTNRVKVPSASLKWLIQRLEDQGTALSQLTALPPGEQADMAQAILNRGPGSMSGMAQQPIGALNVS